MSQVNETKRTPVITCETVDGGLLLSCMNGETIRVRLDGLAPSVLEQATLHGLKQKLVDAAAISRNPDTGKSATPDEKWSAVRGVYDRLLRGEWNATREGGAGGSGGLLFRALVRMYPAKTADQLREYLDGKTKAEQAALRLNPKVAEVIEEIKAEQAKSGGVDSDGLLGELDD